MINQSIRIGSSDVTILIVFSSYENVCFLEIVFFFTLFPFSLSSYNSQMFLKKIEVLAADNPVNFHNDGMVHWTAFYINLIQKKKLCKPHSMELWIKLV